jgi:hypothetical protein
MERTWKPTVAGILDIVGGASGVIGPIVLLLGIMFFIPIAVSGGPGPIPDMPRWMIPNVLSSILIIWLVLVLAVGILSIIGGIYAIQRKNWGLALAGSIAAIFGSFVMGILATIFVVMSKEEFE